VSLQDSQARNNGIAVLRREGASTALAHVIPLPGTPAGLALTSDEQLLLVADGIGVAVLDAAKAAAGTQDVLLHLTPRHDMGCTYWHSFWPTLSPEGNRHDTIGDTSLNAPDAREIGKRDRQERS
jgi:hypothetical protein